MRTLLIVYDNGSYTHNFPQGLGYIAAILEREGCEVVVWNQDMHHYPDEELTRYLDRNEPFDMIGVSVIAGYYQYRRLLSLSQAINRAKRRPKWYVIGGYGPTPEPEYFLQKTEADIVVLGEGEETLVELIEVMRGRREIASVEGIAYRDGGRIVVRNRRPLIADIDSIPLPAYHLFPIAYYRLHPPRATSKSDFTMPMMSGRGCTFKCTFCYRMDTGFRPRGVDSIMEEVSLLHHEFGITRISFFDDLLMSSVARTEEVCRAFLKSGMKVKWDCNGRLNYAKPDLLKLMKESGCVYINYGIEAMDDEVMRKMKKGLRTQQVVAGVEATIAADIIPGLNIIFGNIGDNRETLQKGVDFLIKYGDADELRTIRPVTPYPGSPLYDYSIQKGLLKDIADFYENKHLNSDLLCVNFTELTDDEYYEALKEANMALVNDYYDKLRTKALAGVRRLYDQRDANFRGFREK